MPVISSVTKPVRRRDPESTRMSILDAAQICLARDGAEGVSVSSVAKLAGVNRGTAYQHFQSKEALIQATLDRVSMELLDAVFFEGEHVDDFVSDSSNISTIAHGMMEFNLRLAEFTIENPDMSRIWLFDLLSRRNPEEDLFYKRFLEGLRAFVRNDMCEPGVDPEALAVTISSGYFMWPIWVTSHTKTKKERQKQARRMAREVVRIQCFGVFKDVDEELINASMRSVFD